MRLWKGDLGRGQRSPNRRLRHGVYFQDLSVQERVELTLAVRDSGRVLAWDAQSLGGRVGQAQHGSVGDTVSLMLAPMLAAAGRTCP